MIEPEAQLAVLARARGRQVATFDPDTLPPDSRRRRSVLVAALVGALAAVLLVGAFALTKDRGADGSGSVFSPGSSGAAPTSGVLWLNPPSEAPDSAVENPAVIPTLPPGLDPSPATLRLQDQLLALLPDDFAVSSSSETKVGEWGLAWIGAKGPGPSVLNVSARTVAGDQPDTDPQGPALEVLTRTSRGTAYGLERPGIIDAVFLRPDGLQLTARLQPDIWGGLAADQTISDWVPPMTSADLAATLGKLAAEQPPTARATESASMSELDVRARIAHRDYRAVEETRPDLLVPRLPKGFRLMNVSTGGVGAVDLTWYRKADEASVHLWQTNDPGFPSDLDPTDPSTGTAVTIDGQTWVRNTINACGQTTCLSRRLPSGRLLSLNGTLPVEQMMTIAATIQ